MDRIHPPLPITLLAILIALITLGSCVPQGGQRQTLLDAQGGRGNTANTPPSPNPPSTPQPPEDKQLYWFTQQNQGTSLPLSAQNPRAFFCAAPAWKVCCKSQVILTPTIASPCNLPPLPLAPNY